MPNMNWREEIAYTWILECLQKLLDNYGQNYQAMDDITPATINHLLEGILLAYQDFDLEENLLDVEDAIRSYFGSKYGDDFPGAYPEYPNSDRRDINLRVVTHLRDTNLLPRDAQLLINYMHTPEGETEEATKKMEVYFRQLDFKARGYENRASYQVIKKQRAEAEAKGEERPVRPSKRLMFEILTGKQAPEVIPNYGYTEKIIPSGQKSVDYYATLTKGNDDEGLDLKIAPLVQNEQA